jgi:hypothetical protein
MLLVAANLQARIGYGNLLKIPARTILTGLPAGRSDHFQHIRDTHRIEYRFQVVEPVFPPSGYRESQVYLAVGKNNHRSLGLI